MIVGELKEWSLLPGLVGLEPAFHFLEDPHLLELPAGKYPIDGKRIATFSFTLVRGPSKSFDCLLDPAEHFLWRFRIVVENRPG